VGTRPKNIVNVNDGLLNINTEKLYKEYCANSFMENSIMKMENLHNDFKIILKLIESLKNEMSADIKDSTSKSVNTTNNANNLIDF
jgi:mevalonate pyrophosphate decarboxylase